MKVLKFVVTQKAIDALAKTSASPADDVAGDTLSWPGQMGSWLRFPDGSKLTVEENGKDETLVATFKPKAGTSTGTGYMKSIIRAFKDAKVEVLP
jgi:hypothetical protein